jgi:hypothetical protein
MVGQRTGNKTNNVNTTGTEDFHEVGRLRVEAKSRRAECISLCHLGEGGPRLVSGRTASKPRLSWRRRYGKTRIPIYLWSYGQKLVTA